jgi:hypothetical protein
MGLVEIPLEGQHATVRFTRVLLVDLTAPEQPSN